jgi:hypothetical protein
MVKRKNVKLADNRLSIERVARCLSDNILRKERVFDKAKDSDMCIADEYTGCKYEESPSLRKLFMETATAVEMKSFDYF